MLVLVAFTAGTSRVGAMGKRELRDTLIKVAMSNLPTGAFICDREGVVQFINAAYAKYLGLRPEEAIGRHITELIPTSGIPAVLRSHKAELRQIRRFPNGGATLIVNRVPLFDDDGELIGALSMTLFDTADQVRDLLEHVQCLDKKVSSCQRRIKSALSSPYTVESIIGKSESIAAFKSLLLRYAHTGAAVLILGATGSGKELAAGAIHAASSRAEGPFVSIINCAAIPKELFESEVFGYAPGAFSGARKEGSVGKIEVAHQGTLFLDEVGDLPLQAQAKLLRVLEEKRLFRLGSSQPRDVDFRLVAATNRNISAMLSAGSFREDLYYRINTFVLEIPPLCERADDILPIARYVLSRMGLEHLAFAPEAEAAMLAFSWPGNVRQLHNAVVHAATMRHGDVIQVDDFPPDTLPSADLPLRAVAAAGDLSDIMADTEAVVIRKVLAEQGGNVSRTARTLHIARATLYEKLRKYGISRRST